ncbi:TIGR03620 family F420-dependent LLM class oxidoreductase (plasmid) [Rhodococcus sp. ZPP]|uniref:TIGR03620 family F420-dependent LLM class oxidoreductase n=1 Tax=Rhodococcus sp. ZPP TaxID=2749906 RepID=UPI001AD86312|nr:TIGR03620 family F420-dependent LLM class oxidoreductase [Rhodococcus sp. ZPP]QTJ70528.1 TIGR03620 family F420-dependent LLM class oxidoreductase [Rhodococcus sp. ZPP]
MSEPPTREENDRQRRRFAGGLVGIWTATLDPLPVPRALEVARQIEEQGFTSLWLPGDAGRDALVAASSYLAATERLTIGTGVASIYARDARSVASGRRALWELYGDRYVLGLGVSHQSFVARRGQSFGPPIPAMTAYLTEIAHQPERQQVPDSALTILGALGPKMLHLARSAAGGALTYNATVDHTRRARTALGAHSFLAVTQPAIMADSESEARKIARTYLRFYHELPNYVRHFRRLGFTESDLEGNGSDRLIDELFAWGADGIRSRVAAQLDAGADHVAINLLAENRDSPPLEEWRELRTAVDEFISQEVSR